MGAALVLGAPGDGTAKLLDTSGELVAHALQLAEVEQPRGVLDWHRTISEWGCDVGEAFGHKLRELTLEPLHLTPQLSPGRPLGSYGVR
ncbi:MAG TPA: hypothetical protein VHT29_09670 [Solirubrobacteraceae bacterium]|nr:hypothetical protein [Solirubrobacteraceae bacterium]